MSSSTSSVKRRSSMWHYSDHKTMWNTVFFVFRRTRFVSKNPSKIGVVALLSIDDDDDELFDTSLPHSSSPSWNDNTA